MNTKLDAVLSALNTSPADNAGEQEEEEGMDITPEQTAARDQEATLYDRDQIWETLINPYPRTNHELYCVYMCCHRHVR